MKTSIKSIITGLIFSTFILVSANSFSYDSYYDGTGQATDGEMMVDLFIARPLGLVGSVLGIATHGVGLLFSVPGENFSETGEVLVEAPLNYTFNRPLGHFEDY